MEGILFCFVLFLQILFLSFQVMADMSTHIIRLVVWFYFMGMGFDHQVYPYGL